MTDRDVVPRRFEPEDAEALTRLLNEAYSELQEGGLNFTAATQDVGTTRRRVEGAACWVVEDDGELVATMTLVISLHEGLRALTAAAREPGRAWIEQVAVAKSLRGRNVARQLFDVASAWAIDNGITSIGLDTAVPATHLAAMYSRWGFEPVDTIHFEGKTYDSVVLVKQLAA